MNELLIDQISGKLPQQQTRDMESFINMLWDQDMDMGVDRHIYDPALREAELKKQQAEQDRLMELKKKQAQQESKYFTIDEETGERIPRPSVGLDRSLSEVTDLSKELAELSELAGWDYDNKEPPIPDTPQELLQPAPQQPLANFNDIIIETADNPNPFSDMDLWPTEITMLPAGPSSDIADIVDASEDLDMTFMSQLLHTDRQMSSSAGVSGEGADELSPSYMQQYKNGTEHSFFSQNASHYVPDHMMGDNLASDGDCTFSADKDVKPNIMFNQSSCHMASADSSSSSGYSGSGSENGDNSGMTKADRERERRSTCRDEMRCSELGIPFTVEMITNYPVEEFNSLLRVHQLSAEQLTVIKDIRRRGKNKVAAQNCRKKKLNELTELEVEINGLKRKRTDLIKDKEELKKRKVHLRKQLDQTYAEVFNSIRDHLGRPYDPRFYTLHLSDDGDARIIPNKVSTYALLNYQQSA